MKRMKRFIAGMLTFVMIMTNVCANAVTAWAYNGAGMEEPGIEEVNQRRLHVGDLLEAPALEEGETGHWEILESDEWVPVDETTETVRLDENGNLTVLKEGRIVLKYVVTAEDEIGTATPQDSSPEALASFETDNVTASDNDALDPSVSDPSASGDEQKEPEREVYYDVMVIGEETISGDLLDFLRRMVVYDETGTNRLIDTGETDGSVPHLKDGESYQIIFYFDETSGGLQFGYADAATLEANGIVGEAGQWMFLKLADVTVKESCTGGEIKDDKDHVVGEFKVVSIKDENGNVHSGKGILVKFNNNENGTPWFAQAQDSHLSLKFTCKLEAGENPGKTHIVGDAGGIGQVFVDVDQTPAVKKSASEYNAEQQTIDYTVEVTNPEQGAEVPVTEINDKIRIKDKSGKPAITLQGGNVSLIITRADGSTVEVNPSSYELTTTSEGEFTISDIRNVVLQPGDKLKLTYTAHLENLLLEENQLSFNLNNEATVTYDGSVEPETVTTTTEVTRGGISKLGELEYNEALGKYQVCWTIRVYEPHPDETLIGTTVTDTLPYNLPVNRIRFEYYENKGDSNYLYRKSYVWNESSEKAFITECIPSAEAGTNIAGNLSIQIPNNSEVQKKVRDKKVHYVDIKIETDCPPNGTYVNTAVVKLPSDPIGQTHTARADIKIGNEGIKTDKSLLSSSTDGKIQYQVTVDVSANLLLDNNYNAPDIMGGVLYDELKINRPSELGQKDTYLDVSDGFTVTSVTATYTDENGEVSIPFTPVNSYAELPTSETAAKAAGNQYFVANFIDRNGSDYAYPILSGYISDDDDPSTVMDKLHPDETEATVQLDHPTIYGRYMGIFFWPYAVQNTKDYHGYKAGEGKKGIGSQWLLKDKSVKLTITYEIDSSKIYLVEAIDGSHRYYHYNPQTKTAGDYTLKQYFADEGAYELKNTATANIGSHVDEDDVELQLRHPLTKNGVLEDYNPDDVSGERVSTYTVTFNNRADGAEDTPPVPRNAQNLVFTDTFKVKDHADYHMEYVAGSLKVRRVDLSDGTIQEFAYMGQNPVTETDTISASWSDFSNGSVTLQQKFNSEGSSSYKYEFIYQLKATAELRNSTEVSKVDVHNTANVSWNGSPGFSAEHDLQSFPNGVLTKEAELKNGILKYYVEVNQAAQHIGTDENILRLFDDFRSYSNLVLLEDSVSVEVPNSNGTAWVELDSTQYKKTVNKGTDGKPISMEIEVPNDRHLRVVYSFKVADRNRSVSITNTAKLSYSESLSSSVTSHYSADEVSASAGQSLDQFTLIKKNDSGETLPGAEFELYTCQTNLAGNEEITEVSDDVLLALGDSEKWKAWVNADNSRWYKVKSTYTTGEDGQVVVDWQFTPDMIYILAEKKAPTGYQKTDPVLVWFFGEKTAPNYNYSNVQTFTGGDEITIYNTRPGYVPQVEKKVEGNPESRETFTFQITADATNPVGAIPPAETTATVEGKGIAEFAEIKFTQAGTYKFTINEVAGSTEGYTYDEAVWTLTVKVEEQDGELKVTGHTYSKNDATPEVTSTKYATFTNTYVETITKTVKKVWADGENQDGIRPGSISVQLLADGATSGSPVTLNAANGWSYTWEKLPKKANGDVITYTVREIGTVTGYTTSYSADTFTITNTHTPNVVEKTVTKVWADNDDQDGLRPERIRVQLYAGSEASGEAVELNSNNGWSYTWTDLPEKAGGEEITYTVEELGEITGYTTAYDQTTLTITNTHTPNVVEKTVTKVWADNENQDGQRPESIRVQLYANGEAVGETVELNADNGWSYTWTDLPENAGGEEITYTVEELGEITGYTTAYDQTTLTITNTHTPNVVEKTVTKVWADNENQDGQRPESIRVQLYANGEAVGETVELNAANGWSYTWTDLPENARGEEITYTVEELGEITGYTTAYDQTTLTITNTHTPATVEKTVTKTWNDNNNQDGRRPAGISVQLLADGVASGEPVTLNEANGWTYTWTDLPQYAGGKESVYSVVETAVDGYTVSYDGSGDIFTITNSYTPGQTSRTVLKVWDDANDHDGLRPDSVSVQLLADGAAYGEAVTLNTGNNWRYTWTGLPEMAAGERIVYTVTEISEVDGYEAVVTEDEATLTFTVTNTHVPVLTGGLSVTKTISGNAAEADRAFRITVTLTPASGEAISGTFGEMVFENNQAVVELRGGETVTAEGLPAGTGYSVVEDSYPEYTVTYTNESGTITDGVTAGAVVNNDRTEEPTEPGNPPSENPPSNPRTPEEIPENPVPTTNVPPIENISDEPTPLSSFERLESIEDDEVPLAFMAPVTGDETPAGAAALFGLIALGMMGAFGILAFKKEDDEA